MLVGDYSYIGTYQFKFADGATKTYRMSYHHIKDSAESLKNAWAVELLQTIEPLQKQLCAQWEQLRLKLQEQQHGQRPTNGDARG